MASKVFSKHLKSLLSLEPSALSVPVARNLRAAPPAHADCGYVALSALLSQSDILGLTRPANWSFDIDLAAAALVRDRFVAVKF